MCAKYFEEGDNVKVIDGRYAGETAIVTKVNEEDISMPSVRLEDSNRELPLNTCVLQIMNEKEKDDIKVVKMRANVDKSRQSLQLEAQRNS
jgi:ribosomal protein L24